MQPDQDCVILSVTNNKRPATAPPAGTRSPSKKARLEPGCESTPLRCMLFDPDLVYWMWHFIDTHMESFDLLFNPLSVPNKEELKALEDFICDEPTIVTNICQFIVGETMDVAFEDGKPAQLCGDWCVNPLDEDEGFSGDSLATANAAKKLVLKVSRCIVIRSRKTFC